MNIFNSVIRRKYNKLEIFMLVISGLLLVKGITVGVDAWMNRPVMCVTQDGTKVVDVFRKIISPWDDALRLASITPRKDLPLAISSLQTMRRDVRSQSFPKCAQKAKNILYFGMGFYIDAFLYFSNEDEDISSEKIDKGKRTFDIFYEELEKLEVPQKPPNDVSDSK